MSQVTVPKFEGSKLFRIYLCELQWLAINIKNKCSQIFDYEKQLDPSRDYIVSNPVLWELLSSALSDAARLKKLIISPSNKPKLSQDQWTLMQERTTYLQSILSTVALNEISNPKLRNTIEHFDEYLDAANIELLSPVRHEKIALYKLGLTAWNLDIFKPYGVTCEQDIYKLQFYLIKERNFTTLIILSTFKKLMMRQ